MAFKHISGSAEEKAFAKRLTSFIELVAVSSAISSEIGEREEVLQVAWGSWLLFRMIHSAESIILILSTKSNFREDSRIFPLDHYTVASITRSMLDASIMLAYVTEKVTAEEFDVR